MSIYDDDNEKMWDLLTEARGGGYLARVREWVLKKLERYKSDRKTRAEIRETSKTKYQEHKINVGRLQAKMEREDFSFENFVNGAETKGEKYYRAGLYHENEGDIEKAAGYYYRAADAGHKDSFWVLYNFVRFENRS